MNKNNLERLFGQLKLVLLSVLVISLTACFGKGKSADDVVSAQPSVDMTRPPTTIKDASAKENETDPDETVSFEKWTKERQGDDK